MKPSFTRRYRRRSKPAKNEGAFFKKESKAEQGFFGEASHDAFFQPAVSNGQVVQRKCTCCDHSGSGEKEEQKVQRAAMDDKKDEDDKKLQRAADKKDEDDKQLLRVSDKKEEEDKKLQRATDKKEEDDKKLMRVEEKKEEDKKLQRAPEKKEEEDKKLKRATDKKEEEDKKLMRASASAEASADKEDDKKLQKKESGATPAANHVGGYVSSLNGKGHSMPPLTNQFFAERMGYDFSQVKLHTDKEAAESAKSVNAKAYTIGNNIVFNEGQYNIQSQEGKHLLAHELTHVMQNNPQDETIQRETPSPVPGEPAPPLCEGEAEITTEYKSFLTEAQEKIKASTTLTDERKAELLGGIQRAIAAEGNVNIQNYKTYSCSKINTNLELKNEKSDAASDAVNKMLWLTNATWSKAAAFMQSDSYDKLIEFFQIIAHEKRHGTLGNVQVDGTKLNKWFNQKDADQGAYRVEEIIIKAEEFYTGRMMAGESYMVPIKDQLAIRKDWAMVEATFAPEESTRLRQFILSTLRKRYGMPGGCDHSVTVGVFFCMDKGAWYQCNAGNVLGRVPEELKLCKNGEGRHSVCPVH